MAGHSVSHVPEINQEDDTSSDYGSEFTPEEEDLLNQLLLNVSAKSTPVAILVEGDEAPGSVRTRPVFGQCLLPGSCEPRFGVEAGVSVERSGKNGERKAQRVETGTRENSIAVKSTAGSETSDARSPLERFRTPPKKALTVTDLVSPAWCELQYFYALAKHGRVRRTSVMKRGSDVHKDLEEQVHKTVLVDATTMEDAWGLRLWNVIQGLRTLRETGMTRELEIWGIVDGLLVNGKIDEISFTCPDEELEAEDLSNKESDKNIPTNQSLITDFVGVLGKSGVASRKVYLTDIKTRRSRSLPSGASFRPTVFQLMLYHRFFSDLVSNRFDADIIFRRYRIDPSANFSDSFITQIAALDGYHCDSNVAGLGMGEFEDGESRDLLGLLLQNNSVKRLWDLMMQEFQLTVPTGVEGVGVVLKAEYRSQVDGSVFGQKTFLHENELLDKYLADEIMWWRGKREARGVSVEEAYKCQTCEFAGDCGWRIAKIEESTRNHRKKREGEQERVH
ncbi:hypothetical protein FGG08_005517 [Glutinoglossum americanum]|uniref:Exonuclease V n=1 Tax=Glutinoglossum americanum TaxID=1670608 RepID=A0A9P8HUC2_9PEZI|nr:hypothetical protein FGG08_005517 [Glutinoglossum americanum]